MIRLLVVCLALNITLTNTSVGQAFSGQVFVMTHHLSADGCQSEIECDCCASDILFLTAKKFIMVHNCIYNDGYYRGTYTVEKAYLTLKFDQFVIKEIFNDETNETKVEKQSIKMPQARFYISTCNSDKLTLQRIDLKVLTKAFKDRDETAAEKISNLKTTLSWKQLQ